MKFNKLLWRASFITHFSRSDYKPFFSAIIRTAFAEISAIIFGVLIALSLWHTNMPHDLPTFWLFCVIAVIGYILGGFIIFTVNSTNLSQNRNSNFDNILLVIPVRRMEKWLLRLAPTICILIIVCSLGISILAAIAHSMQANIFVLCVGLIFGLLSGLGLTQLSWPRNMAHKAVIFITTASLNIWVLSRVVTITNPGLLNLILLSILLLLALPFYGYIDLFNNINGAPHRLVGRDFRYLLPNTLIPKSWFILKLIRNRRSISSLSVCLLFSISTALLLSRQSASITSSTWLVLPAVLSAAYACDIRGLMRRYNSAEIKLISGSLGISILEITGAFLASLLIGMPVLLVLATSSNLGVSTVMLLATFLSIQIFSASIGLLASTIFVPTSDDIGSQFFSAMLATSAILIFPKLANFANLSTINQNFRWLSLGILSWIIVILIETTRSNNYGSS